MMKNRRKVDLGYALSGLRKMKFRCVFLVLIGGVVISLYTYSSSSPAERKWTNRNFISTSSLINFTMSADRRKQTNRTPEVRHIAFLKVHKCASSTIQNVFYRFGIKRDLNFILPKSGNYIHFFPIWMTEVPLPPHSHYDILCNHMDHFSMSTVAEKLPADTFYLAIVREPFQRLKSAFEYYRYYEVPLLMEVKGDNPFETYLQHPETFESRWRTRSFTNNLMVRDFGYDFENLENELKFMEYLKELDQSFHLVMVTELFDESILIMRRMLNWHMKEVLYYVQNTRLTKSVSKFEETPQLSPYLALDRILYDFFLKKLKKFIEAGGSEFQDEVKYFKELNKRASTFCVSDTKEPHITIESSKYHGLFQVSRDDCELMKTPELDFLEIVRQKQIAKL